MAKTGKRPRLPDPKFQERLKNLLAEKGIVRNRDFAKAIGRSETVTIEWLKGKMPTYPEDWLALCDFFATTADYLFLGKARDREIFKIEFPMSRKLKDFLERLFSAPIERRGDTIRRTEDQLLWYMMYNFLDYRLSSAGQEHTTAGEQHTRRRLPTK